MMLVALVLMSAMLAVQCYQDVPAINPALYETIESALVKDKSNIMKLRYLFYSFGPTPQNYILSISSCAFVVKRINKTQGTDLPAFRNDCIECSIPTDYYCYGLFYNDIDFFFPGPGDMDTNQLYKYVADLDLFLKMIDFSSFKLFTMLTFSSRALQILKGDYYNENLPGLRVNLSISIDELDVMPQYNDVYDVLSMIIIWSKYYARSQGTLTVPRFDSDIVKYVDDGGESRPYYQILLTLLYIVIVLTAILGIYSLSKILKIYSSKKLIYGINQFYWATVIVCGVINLTCFIISLCFLDFNNIYIIISTILLCHMSLIAILEVISVWIVVKDFSTSNPLCGNHYVSRAIHTLAICQVLWFLHRVTLNLIVAMYFVALAPAQTLATITLIYAVIFCTIIYIAYNLHCFKLMRSRSTKRCCGTTCRLFITFILYCGVIGILFCITTIFNQMAANGLTSTGLGSVLLSLVAPTIVFIINI